MFRPRGLGPEESEEGEPKAHIDVWRSVRAGGDTKTRKSRRSLAIPQRCVDALRAQQARQGRARSSASKAGKVWPGVRVGDRDGVGRGQCPAGFHRIAKAAGLNAEEWTPRELRHSFVSLLADAKVPLEVISCLVGHSGTSVTEQIYRHQIRPVVEDGATEMDRIFPNTAA